MSEQPRRRKRIETETVPQSSQDNTAGMLAEERIIAQVEKPPRQWQKRPFVIACLISSAILLAMQIALFIAYCCLDESHIYNLRYKLYSIFSIGMVLFITATFVFNAKKKRIPAIISATIASALAIYIFLVRSVFLSIRYMMYHEYDISQVLSSFFRGLYSTVPYIALLFFAIMKKKRRNIWNIIGVTIVLLQIITHLIPYRYIPYRYIDIYFWIPTFLKSSNNNLLLLYFLRDQKIEPFRWLWENWEQLFCLFDLMYGFIFFFGMASMPRRRKKNDNHYPLLEQYKREHGM